MPIQWSPLALTHTDSNASISGPNWSSPVLNRTPVPPFQCRVTTTREVLSNYTFPLSFPFSPPMHASALSSATRRVSSRSTHVRPSPRHLIKPQITSSSRGDPHAPYPSMIIEMLISIQMYICGCVCIPLMYVLLLYAGVGGFYVAMDAAKAVLGLAINIAAFDPQRPHARAYVCRILVMIIRLCIKLILNGAFIKMITFILIYINIQGTDKGLKQQEERHPKSTFRNTSCQV